MMSPTLRAVRQVRWVRVVALRLASMYSVCRAVGGVLSCIVA